jgi:hypothetical protein
MIQSFQDLGRAVSETRIYSAGKRPDGTPNRLLVPIPVLGVAWFFGVLLCTLALGRVLGIGLLAHHGSAASLGPTVMFYLGPPVLIAYVMALAEVEGRRVHVILRVWIRQGRAKHFVGGWLPVSASSAPVRFRGMKVRRRG